MVSIIMTYYNRKELLIHTLKSIEKSKTKDYEVIVVDDGSSDENKLDDIINDFSFLKVIKLKNKWYFNPCIPFNIGIEESVGDIIILQNPECLHVHDIITYTIHNLNNYNYLSYGTYGLNETLTSDLYNTKDDINNFIKSQKQQPYNGGETIGWYNHSKYRPTYYHFCAAITRKNMKKLNGFDERYAYGVGYDDNEILARIKNLGLKLILEDDINVIHQYHPHHYNKLNDFRKLLNKNLNLFNRTTLKENIIKVNPHKVIIK